MALWMLLALASHRPMPVLRRRTAGRGNASKAASPWSRRARTTRTWTGTVRRTTWAVRYRAHGSNGHATGVYAPPVAPRDRRPRGVAGLPAEREGRPTDRTMCFRRHKFGQTAANERRRCPRPDGKTAPGCGAHRYRWHAAAPVEGRRSGRYREFLRKLLKGFAYVPRVPSTERLTSDGAAHNEAD